MDSFNFKRFGVIVGGALVLVLVDRLTSMSHIIETATLLQNVPHRIILLATGAGLALTW